MIRIERVVTSKDPVDIKNIIREYYEKLYTHKFNNLDKVDQVLEKQKLIQITQYKKDAFNIPMAIKGIEFVILKLPPKKEIFRIRWIH